MRYRIKNYTVEGQNIILPHEITIEDLRLLINETQEMTLCSSMYKNKALVKKDGTWVEIPNAVTINGNIITIMNEACKLSDNDVFTIEVDKGDNIQDIVEQIDEDVAFQLKQILGYE